MMTYPSIFQEAFQNGFFVPLNTEPTLHAIHAFGGGLALPILAAVAGATLSGWFSWMVGSWVAQLRGQGRFSLSDKQYGVFTRFMQRYGIWLLPFSAASMGGLMPLIAGFALTPIRTSLLLIALGRLVYYTGLFYFGWWK